VWGLFPQAIASQAVGLAHLGRLDEAEALVDQWLDPGSGDSVSEAFIHLQVLLLQAAILLGKKKAAATLARGLSCVANLAGADFLYTCVGRHLGDAAVLLGDLAAARGYYAQALEVAGKIRFRPELALTHVSLAELLLQETDGTARSDALEHLEIAIPELQDMKMQPALERALALKDKFVAAAPHSSTRRSASDTLTAREREIASLIADGLSNRDIAEKLVISEGTVDVHVKHILGKLGFRSRAQVAGWFARQGTG
jgi:ATP/maltotriose-dependent transcriptional regulator MalT